ncbi:MAG: DinB family protein [Dokdonella sp.]|uniref:DinB family protein n=1 Tax=Dokdonella sp. TaxID=2291710 RepID=UPI003263EC2B
MDRKSVVDLLASYNGWMNESVYAAARGLPTDELTADRGAFFGSILKTLNHLVIADTIWLKRFASHPAGYSALEPMLLMAMPDTADLLRYSDLHSLSAQRSILDNLTTEWARSIKETDLDYVMNYTNSRGEMSNRVFFGLVLHFFNHQTHHRGQITTLLSQAGVDVGVTDLLALVPEISGA